MERPCRGFFQWQMLIFVSCPFLETLSILIFWLLLSAWKLLYHKRDVIMAITCNQNKTILLLINWVGSWRQTFTFLSDKMSLYKMNRREESEIIFLKGISPTLCPKSQAVSPPFFNLLLVYMFFEGQIYFRYISSILSLYWINMVPCIEWPLTWLPNSVSLLWDFSFSWIPFFASVVLKVWT